MNNLPSFDQVQFENENSAYLDSLREETLAKMDADFNRETNSPE